MHIPARSFVGRMTFSKQNAFFSLFLSSSGDDYVTQKLSIKEIFEFFSPHFSFDQIRHH